MEKPAALVAPAAIVKKQIPAMVNMKDRIATLEKKLWRLNIKIGSPY